MLRPVCVVLFVCFLPHLVLAQPDSLLSAPLQPLTPSKRGVVFPSALARKFGQQCSRLSPVGWWTPVAPSQLEIKRLESALPTWMKAHRLKEWRGHFSDYFY